MCPWGTPAALGHCVAKVGTVAIAPDSQDPCVGRLTVGPVGPHFLSMRQFRVPRMEFLNSSVVIFERAYPMTMKFCGPQVDKRNEFLHRSLAGMQDAATRSDSPEFVPPCRPRISLGAQLAEFFGKWALPYSPLGERPRRRGQRERDRSSSSRGPRTLQPPAQRAPRWYWRRRQHRGLRPGWKGRTVNESMVLSFPPSNAAELYMTPTSDSSPACVARTGSGRPRV